MVVICCCVVSSMATVAHAEPANLTAQEQAMRQGLPDSDGPVFAPIYYVAPWIHATERTKPGGTTGSLLSKDQIRTMLQQTRPSRLMVGPIVNGGFESGDFTGWTQIGNLGSLSPSVCGTAHAPDEIVVSPGLDAYANNDPCIDHVFEQTKAARLGDDFAWGNDPNNEPKCSLIEQDVVIPTGTTHFSFSYAVLAQNPGHGFGQDPYFEVKVTDQTAATTVYDVLDYTTSFNPGNPCNPWCGGQPGIVYRCWKTVDLDLSAINGHTVRLSLKASDCSPSGHWCEVFVDGASVNPCPDALGPDAAPLAASCALDPAGAGTFCAHLTWNAPSDPTNTLDPNTNDCVAGTGPAAVYDIRYSTSPIVTDADFNAATQAIGEPAPAAPGTAESFDVCGLAAGTYYFAMRSQDATGNKSTVSTASATVCTPNHPPVALCKDVTIEANANCQGVVAAADVDNGSYDPDGDPTTITITPPGPYSLGSTPVVLTISDGSLDDTCHATVTVTDKTKPTITVTPSVDVLWPPNHKMVPIHFTVVTSDACSGSCTNGVTVKLISATSNEPDNGLGDGDFPNDIQDATLGTADFDVLVRRERSGTGTGRIYTFCYEATDCNGNKQTGCATVGVPHDQSGRGVVVVNVSDVSMVLYGAPWAKARSIDPGTVSWGNGDFRQAPISDTPTYEDVDGDYIEDAVYTLSQQDAMGVTSSKNAGLGVYARWSNGGSWYQANLDPEAVTGVAGKFIPTQFAASVRPNPAIGKADIVYALPKDTHVRLSIFDVTGRELARLVDGDRSAGEYTAHWRPSLPVGGIYLYRLQAGARRIEGRFALIR